MGYFVALMGGASVASTIVKNDTWSVTPVLYGTYGMRFLSTAMYASGIKAPVRACVTLVVACALVISCAGLFLLQPQGGVNDLKAALPPVTGLFFFTIASGEVLHPCICNTVC